MYRLFLFKRFIEDVFMFPLVLFGRWIAAAKPLSQEYETFYFFPFYHIGGAEKVHADIAKATANVNCIIFFTRKSQNDLFLKDFLKSGCAIRDISRFTDNKWIYFSNIVFRGIISHYINSQKRSPVVFNGQCNFAYKLSPWIRKSIPQIELIHSLCSFSYIRIPFLPFIWRTVMISTVRIQEHIELYKRFQIPERFADRIIFIMNAIELPELRMPKTVEAAPLEVLYVGRGTPEKRVHLVAEISKKLLASERLVHFSFMGDVEKAVPADLRGCCRFLGNQSEPDAISRIYEQAHVLILVSETEGFPMVIMEAMAKGLAIVSTAVGEIPLHVKDNENGFLIRNFTDAALVVKQGAESLAKLDSDRALLQKMSEANMEYAFRHFGMERFKEQYLDLFSQARSRL